MINFIIFSRKRPMQLWALLESLPNNIKPFIVAKIDPEYKAGYDLVWKKFWGKIGEVVQEENFKLDTLSLIKRKYSAICTDDCIFYREVSEEIPEIDNYSTFSYRYGLNTTLQDHTKGIYQPSLNLYNDKDHYIEWDTRNYQYPTNYSYSMSCDGHIYTSDKLFDLCSRCNFKNSNELESGLQQYRLEIPLIMSHKQSSLVCIPANNLSGYTQSGRFHPYSVEHLNKLFMEGKRINIEKTFKNINVIGSHMELPFVIE